MVVSAATPSSAAATAEEMGTAERDQVRFNRPPRVQRPLASCEIVLPAPPTPGRPPHRNILTLLLPGLGMFFSMGLVSVISYSHTRSWLAMLPTGLMALVSLGSSALVYREQIKAFRRATAEQAERFRRITQFKLEELEKARAEERRVRAENDPSLEHIQQMIEGDALRLWERRPVDPDFARVRVGVGEVAPSVVLRLPDNLDPLSPHYEWLCRVYEQRRTLEDVPVAIDLRQVGSLGVWGDDRQSVLDSVYALLIHLMAHHAPAELRIALLCDGEQASDWDWLKWVPHAEPLQSDLPGYSVAVGRDGARMLLNDLIGIVRPRVSTKDPDPRPAYSDGPPVYPVHYVLVIDGYDVVKEEAAADYVLRNARQAGVTIVDIESDPRDVPDVCQACLEIAASGQAHFGTTGPEPVLRRCRADRLDAHRAGELAREMTNKHQARSTTTVSDVPTNVRLVDALFAGDGAARVGVDEIDLAQAWRRRPQDRTWSILLGQKRRGEPVWLNLLEDRDGPHGLIAGTTGAGKSVLLQSMILSLAVTHSPDEINFVLIDFKGGSTAEVLRSLPHTKCVITNLQGRLVDRSLTLLKAEAGRRQEVLRQAGAKDIATYHASQDGLKPLPRLVVVIDEFAEMAKAMPTFMDEVNSLAAIGRSLGIHLILATQKPAGVVPDKVWANLKFRICLRVASAIDSRDVLGVADAALLSSSMPGRGYLCVASERLELFQSASMLYPHRVAAASSGRATPVIVRRAGLTPGARSAAPPAGTPRAIGGRTELEVLVERLARAGEPVPRWSSPLPAAVTVEQVWQRYDAMPLGRQPRGHGELSRDEPLRVAVGLVDNPHRQSQQPLWVDLYEKHYLVVGAPRSGRSTLLQTLIRALLENTTPAELGISLLDFGGQNLMVFEDAPHVANVLNVNTMAHLRRFLGQVAEDLDRRAQLRARRGLETMPRALYVIDGFAELKNLYPDEINVLARAAREGLALGIHLVVTADQLMSVPLGIRSNLLGRLALRLSDPAEYVDFVGRVGGTLPDALPGRGLVREKATEPVLEFQAALPLGRLDEASGGFAPVPESDRFAGLAALCLDLDQAWTGTQPQPIQILEAAIESQELPEELSPGGRTWGQGDGLPKVVVGRGDRRLDWIEIDYAVQGPHFLVCGPPQSGKTNVLHQWVWNLSERYSPAEMQFTLVGMRNRSLSGLSCLPHVQSVVETEFRLDAALDALRDLAVGRHSALRELVEADPDGDVEAMSASLGPAQIVVVDDFDPVRFTRERQAALMGFCRYGRDTRTFLLLAGASSDLLEFSDLLNYLKRGRCALLLQPGDVEARVADVRLSSSALRQDYPVGRGYLVVGNRCELVQTLHLDGSYLAHRCELLGGRAAGGAG